MIYIEYKKTKIKGLGRCGMCKNVDFCVNKLGISEAISKFCMFKPSQFKLRDRFMHNDDCYFYIGEERRIKMNEKELKLEETPLPEGFQCIDCDLYGFCSNELDISNMFDKNCKFSPSKFKRKKKIDKSCAFYFDGKFGSVSHCNYFCTERNDINCYKCKAYVNEHDAIPKLINYIKNELNDKCNQSEE